MKIMAVGLSVLAVVVCPATAQTSKKNARKAKKIIKQVWKNKLMEQYPRWDEIITDVDKALALDSTNLEANFLAAIYHIRSPFVRNAMPYLKRLERKVPQAKGKHRKALKETYYMLGYVHHFLEEWEQAINYYKIYKRNLKKRELKKRKLLRPAYQLFTYYPSWQIKKKVKLKGTGKIVDKRIEECNNGMELTKDTLPVEMVNLGEALNSPYSEYAPVINADETVIFFTSRRPSNVGNKTDPRDGKPFEDIWMSVKDSAGNWQKAINPGPPINSSLHESVVWVSADGQQIIIYRDINMGDLFIAQLEGTKWSEPKPLPVNTKKYSEKSAVITPDGNRIYFVSDMPGGYGGRDIWYVEKRGRKGKWSTPVNLGPVINTPYDEDGIFLHPDGRTLYFSSSGHNTMGGYDVFKTTYDPATSSWSKPVNVGYPINTPGDDIYFVLSADGKRAYYASFRADGIGEKDIYMVKLKEEKTTTKLEAKATLPMPTPLKPTLALKPAMEVTLVKGIVYDSLSPDKKPLEASILVVDNTTGDTLTIAKANASTGKYLITLTPGKNYGLSVDKEGYLFYSENFNIPSTAKFQEIIKDIPLIPVKAGAVVILRNIFFDFDRWDLKPESYPELDRVVEFMQKYNNIKVEIAGHTDSLGSEEYNLKLSQRRANSVVQYLVSRGVEPSRLVAKGYGESQPIADNGTEEGRALNRRVEFRIVED